MVGKVVAAPVGDLQTFLLRMSRSKVDPDRAQVAVEAVRCGAMSYRAAAAAFEVPRSCIESRVKGKVDIEASVGVATVLTAEEENSIEDALIWAAHRYLGVGRTEVIEAVRKLCSDGRPVPWDPDKGPGYKWLRLFMRRHPRLSERSSRIYEANRVTADDEPRLRDFYNSWKELLDRLQPKADHVWNVDETGASM